MQAARIRHKLRKVLGLALVSSGQKVPFEPEDTKKPLAGSVSVVVVVFSAVKGVFHGCQLGRASGKGSLKSLSAH